MPIEDIKPGCLIWVPDEHVIVDSERITCTPNHSFYSPVKGWTDAIQLKAGDRLQLLNGEYVIIEQVQHELLESPVTVYNFEVKGFHTYFVGETSVLVHNSCGDKYYKATRTDGGVQQGMVGEQQPFGRDQLARAAAVEEHYGVLHRGLVDRIDVFGREAESFRAHVVDALRDEARKPHALVGQSRQDSEGREQGQQRAFHSLRNRVSSTYTFWMGSPMTL